ncbi:MAG TPA: DoxX family protein [Cytophagaceae bacterium]
MDIIRKSDTWMHEHQDSKLLGILRIALGLFILFKGIYFIQDTDQLQRLITMSRIEFGSVVLAHYIAMVHLVGGLLIALGLIVRIAIIFQIPILLGAILFVNSKSVLGMHSELLISILVFLLLVFYLFFGAGRYSVNYYVKKYDERTTY